MNRTPLDTRDTLIGRVTATGQRAVRLSLYDAGKGRYWFSAVECELDHANGFDIMRWMMFSDPSASATIQYGSRSTPAGRGAAKMLLARLEDVTLRNFRAEAERSGLVVVEMRPNRSSNDWAISPAGNLTLTPVEAA